MRDLATTELRDVAGGVLSMSALASQLSSGTNLGSIDFGVASYSWNTGWTSSLPNFNPDTAFYSSVYVTHSVPVGEYSTWEQQHASWIASLEQQSGVDIQFNTTFYC